MRTFLFAALLCGASCDDDLPTNQDLTAVFDLAGNDAAQCPAMQPTGGHCPAEIAIGNISCTYGPFTCICGGEGDWFCSLPQCGTDGVSLACAAVPGGCYICQYTPAGHCVIPCALGAPNCPGGHTCTPLRLDAGISYALEGNCSNFDGYCF
jgi:hypothetical protein